MKFEKIKKGNIIQVGTENFYFLKKTRNGFFETLTEEGRKASFTLEYLIFEDAKLYTPEKNPEYFL